MKITKLEKKKTKAKTISNFKKVLIKDQITKFEISISLKKSIPKNKIASKNKIKKTTMENQRNFPIMKSLLFKFFLLLKYQ